MRGENTPERKVASTWDRTHNHQVKSPTRSPLSHPGGALLLFNLLLYWPPSPPFLLTVHFLQWPRSPPPLLTTTYTTHWVTISIFSPPSLYTVESLSQYSHHLLCTLLSHYLNILTSYSTLLSHCLNILTTYTVHFWVTISIFSLPTLCTESLSHYSHLKIHSRLEHGYVVTISTVVSLLETVVVVKNGPWGHQHVQGSKLGVSHEDKCTLSVAYMKT